MAKTPDITFVPSISASQEDFDNALSQAQIITDIVGQLADAAIGSTTALSASLVDWLVEQLKDRLERVELADMTMRRCRA